MADKIFVSGMIIKRPHEKAPDYIKANLSIHLNDFMMFAETHKKGEWINVDIKESSTGKLYLELNTFVPKEKVDEIGSYKKSGL